MRLRLVGLSKVMRELMAGVDKIAEASDTTVLIEGEPGTGKDWFAHLIHRNTPGRASRPLVVVRCGCFLEKELEKEILGTDNETTTAIDVPRATLEIAVGGTLFLDEVGDLGLGSQEKVLELLGVGGFELDDKPCGGPNVRVIAATSKDLSRLRDCGAFRYGLYRRLSAFHIRLPSLRDRREDIVPLARYFLASLGKRMGRPALAFAIETERLLSDYSFPGNVRELKSMVENAAVRAEKDVVGPEYVVLCDRPETPRGPFFWTALDGRGRPPPLRLVKRRYMERVLDFTNGNRTAAARVLGISLPTLVRKEQS